MTLLRSSRYGTYGLHRKKSLSPCKDYQSPSPQLDDQIYRLRLGPRSRQNVRQHTSSPYTSWDRGSRSSRFDLPILRTAGTSPFGRLSSALGNKLELERGISTHSDGTFVPGEGVNNLVAVRVPNANHLVSTPGGVELVVRGHCDGQNLSEGSVECTSIRRRG